MAYRKGYYRKSRSRKDGRATAVSRKRFTASPAGRHRKIARNCFAIARKAKAAGNYRHYWKMVNFGKRALALSKAEHRLWTRGKALTARSFATHRRAKARLRS
ncbi:MAG: hypothetical protein HKN78_09070 [Sphingomonadaceae bacterium]|nr:hypothetical protein [Sphingomonadaceae bacterium]